MPLFAFVIFGAFIAIAVLIGWLGYLSAKKRRESFQALAATRNWNFVERDDRWSTTFYGTPFETGHARCSANILTGQYDGRGFVAFDYTYKTTETHTNAQGRTTTSESTHPYSVVALETGGAFPYLEVSPEGLFSRVVGRLTNKDIELESEDFNRAFTVMSEDRKFASDILHPRMMEVLMGFTDVAWRFQDTWLLAVESGRHTIQEVEHRLTCVDVVVDNIPDFVWRDARDVPPAAPIGSAP